MESYQEKLAPLFSQILLQKEFEQRQIMREAYKHFKSKTCSLTNSQQEYFRFYLAAQEIKALWNAHRRIKEKRYGKCSECGTGIDLMRLNAHPTAMQCIKCNYKSERHSQKRIEISTT